MNEKLVRMLFSKEKLWVKAIVLVILVGLVITNMNEAEVKDGPSGSISAATPPQKPKTVAPSAAPVAKTEEVTKVNGYDKLRNVVLVDHRNNDGDSFFVRHDDYEFELRLYFIDTAEKYLSRDYKDQRDRVADQAKDFGLSVDQTVDLGNAAKAYVLGLLKKGPFTVYTDWERVYDGDRFHGFVEIPNPDGGKPIYLTELLVHKGLGRIHTKGQPTPDGRHWRDYKDDLRKIEVQAKKAKIGAWGM